MRRYDHKKIEAKWRQHWEEKKTFQTPTLPRGKKFYILDMFPYPSGEGLHVGHPRGYVGSDILARYYRAKGYTVLHPMGFDAFGLPAENAAIKAGLHPRESTKRNIQRFKEQLASFSFSYDWGREINTSDPAYYRFTQWLFLLLYKNNLAYREKAKVNFCPQDQTVLANEQVTDGRCERCGTPVIQKELTQWFFKITDFAEELLVGLERLDWPESTKELQRNWIGKSVGYEIDFPLVSSRARIKVFTTRLDTLFGVTYLVLAPEHPLVKKITTLGKKAEAEAYIRAALNKTDLERQREQKKKTGVWTGAFALNPASKKKIPVFVADYILPHYGTGAVMAVPAHDERDWAFAKEFDLPVVPVIQGGNLPYTGEGKLMNSNIFNGQDSQKAIPLIAELFQAKEKTYYKMRDWLISRQRYWGVPIPIIYQKDGSILPVPEKDLPVLLPTDVAFKPTGLSPLLLSRQFQVGVERKYGKGAKRETDTMDTFVDSAWYFLRYADPKNTKEFADKKVLSAWLPVDLYVGGAEHATGHLIFARFITKVLHKLGYLSFDEPFLKLRHQGLILGPDGFKMSKSRGNVINPDELVSKFGADAFRMYEMFIGPFHQSLPWDIRGIEGVYRFLNRLWQGRRSVVSRETPDVRRALNRLVRKITSDIENLKFNTAVSSFMEFFNHFGQALSRESWRRFLILLYPFAPHLTSEIWSNWRFQGELSAATWPTVGPLLTQEAMMDLPVQVGGKLRGVIRVKTRAAKAEVLAEIKRHVKLRPWVTRAKKIIYKEGRIVNLVI